MRIILALLLLVCFTGCPNTPKEIQSGIATTTEYSYTNGANQHIVVVDYYTLDSWLKSHNNIRIEAISDVGRAGHGTTNAFIIVYRELKK